MNHYRVEFSPEALGQAQRTMDWWHENRPKAPELFLDELEAAIEQLASMPHAGVSYTRSGVAGMKRLLMPRTRYHVYYTIVAESQLVRIHAIWHTSRGEGPQ